MNNISIDILIDMLEEETFDIETASKECVSYKAGWNDAMKRAVIISSMWFKNADISEPLKKGIGLNSVLAVEQI
jgi:hypothetical protein